jgi:ATP/maltotriose-dependent transcriptional regulator MalT
VDAALERFARVGDRWGQATALPLRALMRQYDDDLDGALRDLTQARALAREFGSLSSSDEVFLDLRWIGLHMLRGDQDRAVAMIAGTRDRALRSASPEMTILVDALEAGLWLLVGDLDRAQELIEAAEAGVAMNGQFPFAGDHGQALIGSVRASLCVRRGDGAGAEEALAGAYAAALESRDMPIVALVTVTVASLADLYGRPVDVALMLGAAARLRGTHDRSDLQVRELSARSRAAVGDQRFAEAYEMGWQLDGPAALAQADPARLRREALPAAGSAPPPDVSAQARRA